MRSLINTQPCQLQGNQTLRRMSLIGLVLIPTLVRALNSTIIFLFKRRFQKYIASLCSHFMWVGTYHYQPPLKNLCSLPKNSRATQPKNSQPTRYPTQKLTQKLTTHNGLVGGGTKKLCQHRENCRTLLLFVTNNCWTRSFTLGYWLFYFSSVFASNEDKHLYRENILSS